MSFVKGGVCASPFLQENTGFLKGVFEPSIREGRPESPGVQIPCNLWALAGMFGKGGVEKAAGEHLG